MTTKSFAVKRMITHPITRKPLKRVYVGSGKLKGWYQWNTTWRVYNHTKTYDQLQKQQKNKIDFSKV